MKSILPTLKLTASHSVPVRCLYGTKRFLWGATGRSVNSNGVYLDGFLHRLQELKHHLLVFLARNSQQDPLEGRRTNVL